MTEAAPPPEGSLSPKEVAPGIFFDAATRRTFVRGVPAEISSDQSSGELIVIPPGELLVELGIPPSALAAASQAIEAMTINPNQTS
jgi:hypothetical protein